MNKGGPHVGISDKKQEFFNLFESIPGGLPFGFVSLLLLDPKYTDMIATDIPDARGTQIRENILNLSDDEVFLATIQPLLEEKAYLEALNTGESRIKAEISSADVKRVLVVHKIRELHSSSLGGTPLHTLRGATPSALSDLYNHIWVRGKSVFQTEDIQVPNLMALPAQFKFGTSPESLVDGTSTYSATYMLSPSGSHGFPTPPTGSPKMLVRSGYKEILEILESPASAGRSAAILGQPGIVKRMEQKKRTFLQMEPDYVYYFGERGAFRYGVNDKQLTEDCPKDKEIWYLVDCNERLKTLPNVCYKLYEELNTQIHRVLKIIQTASPDVKHYKRWTKELCAFTYWMDVCTWQDIFLMSLLDARLDTPESLSFFCRKFGPSARFCLAAAGDAMWAGRQDDLIRGALAKLGPNPTTWFPTHGQLTSDGASHALYIVRPDNDQQGWPRVEIGSLYIRQKMLEAADSAGHRVLLDFYRTIRNHSSFGGTAGHIFDIIALQLMSREDRDYKLRSLDPTSDLPPLTLAVKKAVGETTFSTSQDLKDLIPKHLGELLAPTSREFPSIDAIVVDSAGSVWLIQTTTAWARRPINVKGLAALLSSPASHELNSTKMKASDKLRNLVFVVPAEEAAEFKEQRVTGEDSDMWTRVIDQYVLGIDVDSFNV